METVKMTTGICDMHCHILPKLDDGSKSVDETIQAIEEGVRQGIRTMIATPHFYPGRYEADVQTILQKVENIQLICQEQNLPVRLYAGQECFYYSGLLEQLKECPDAGGKPLCTGGIFTGLYLFSAFLWIVRTDKGRLSSGTGAF